MILLFFVLTSFVLVDGKFSTAFDDIFSRCHIFQPLQSSSSKLFYVAALWKRFEGCDLTSSLNVEISKPFTLLYTFLFRIEAPHNLM